VNAWRAGAPFHLRDWLEQQLNSSGPVGLPWTSTLAFLRLVTKPRVFENPEPIGDAWQPANTWLACETAWIPQPTERRGELLGDFSRCLPCMAISYQTLICLRWLWNTGLTLCSTDGDFARFRGLRWLNPVTPRG